jgi:hypothetical protein
MNSSIREIVTGSYLASDSKDIEGVETLTTPDSKQILFVAEFPFDWYTTIQAIIHNVLAHLKYFIFRRASGLYEDNKYLCLIDIDGKNLRKIAKLPPGSEFGRDFVHWEQY